MKNFIIGIGGTGAKGLEHLIHACSAGLGPSNLWAGMVDQDEANGNVSRTKILLNKFTRDFTGATMLRWKELENKYWGKFGLGF